MRPAVCKRLYVLKLRYSLTLYWIIYYLLTIWGGPWGMYNYIQLCYLLHNCSTRFPLFFPYIVFFSWVCFVWWRLPSKSIFYASFCVSCSCLLRYILQPTVSRSSVSLYCIDTEVWGYVNKSFCKYCKVNISHML